MTSVYEESYEYYKTMPVTISGITKNEVPRKAEIGMDNAQLVAFYSERYCEADNDAFLISQRQERLNGLCNLVQPGEYYLDVGCAMGTHMNLLYHKGIYGIGLDIAVPNILKGREKYPHLKFIHGFAEDIPFGDEYFDVVIMGDVLEHVREPTLALAECLRVAKKGLAVCIPVNAEYTDEHISPFNYEKFKEFCQYYELDVTAYDFKGNVLDVEANRLQLPTFPWLLARAIKSNGTDERVRQVLSTAGNAGALAVNQEILSKDEWSRGPVIREETHNARFKLLSHLIEGHRVLEIGCGNGDLSIEVARNKFNITGVDISPSGIKQAQEKARAENLEANTRFLVADVTRLELPDNSFDTVLIPEVLEHVRNSRKFIEQAIRAVRNGGRIIITVPDGLMVPWEGHLRIFFREILASELSQYTSDLLWHELPFKKWLICSFFVKKPQYDIKDGPVVDILMPTYNGKRYIRNAVKSIIAQTYQNWELIVVNDGGEDVKEILDEFRDNRIKYLVTEHRGKSHALNVALANSNGEFIAYLDDDDILYPMHLEELIGTALSQKKDFVYADWYEVSVDENQREIERSFLYRQDVEPWMLIHQNYINHRCIMHQRSLLERTGLYDEQLDITIDWDMIRRLAFISAPQHIWSVTSEHMQYYAQGIMANRISRILHTDLAKARKSLEAIIDKTMNLSADAIDLKKALVYALSRSYYHQLDFDNILRGKDIQMQALRSTIDGLNALLQDKEQQIRCLDTALQDREQQIRDLHTAVQANDAFIQQVMGGVVMRLMTKYKLAIDKIFRPGTRLRSIYERGFNGIRAILNEGFGAFTR